MLVATVEVMAVGNVPVRYGSPLGPFHMRNSSVYARTASVRVCSWNCSCPICSRSAIIEIELDLALGTAKIENILR